MKTLIIVESLFGNTRAVAEAIAAGLPGEVTLRTTRDAVPDLELPDFDRLDLLLVGGPTHAFGMTREGTRADAVKQGAPRPAGGSKDRGVREWVAEVRPRPDLRVVTFDTRVKHFPGSAARGAAKALRSRGFRDAGAGESFWVKGTPGPLLDGELDRAREWATTLAV